MPIPTEVVGSLPRPTYLQKAFADYDAGKISLSDLQSEQDKAAKDSVERMEATGSQLVTDGEQRASSFATYPIIDTLGGAGLADNLKADGQYFAIFDDGHHRQLPRLTKGPLKYRTYASDYFKKSKPYAKKCGMKQAVIAPSMLYLLYPLDGEVEGYPKSDFVEDLVNECEKDIRTCFDAGAARVSIDFTEGRLAAKNDKRNPWTGAHLLKTFVDLYNQVLDRFSAAERKNIGIHTCPGGDCDSVHSFDVDYHELLPSMFQMNAGYFLIQLASEKDKEKVYKEIGETIRKDANGVKQVAFIGVVNPLDPNVETPEQIRDAILTASKYIPTDQLGATDDCGFSPFSIDVKPKHGSPDFARDIAFWKISNRVKGVQMASPFTALLLADYGADILRIDRAHPSAHSSTPPPPTADLLTRHKSSIAVNLKTPAGIDLVKSLVPTVDIVIDPFRPGVLEKCGLSPEKVLLRLNPRLIVARMTGFRRDGKYAAMAGHDINYIAVSGVLALLGRKNEKPYAPANIMGDFAGGGAMCFMGILLALLAREGSGLGQVVEANMVDGSNYLASMPRLGLRHPIWDRPRGDNLLDGGCPYYDTYETRDGKFMSVGALEPQFFAALLKGLDIDPASLPGPREDRDTWPALADLFTRTFKSKARAEWEAIFDGTDACCTPVLTYPELERGGFDQRPPVTLKGSPGIAIADGENDRPAAEGVGIGIEGDGWVSKGLPPGKDGEEKLAKWMGWIRGRQYDLVDGGLVKMEMGRNPYAKL